FIFQQAACIRWLALHILLIRCESASFSRVMDIFCFHQQPSCVSRLYKTYEGVICRDTDILFFTRCALRSWDGGCICVIRQCVASIHELTATLSIVICIVVSSQHLHRISFAHFRFIEARRFHGEVEDPSVLLSSRQRSRRR
uniref:Secreted protein n=1 Tax=Parascaris univalens TaxID=6257 RepID=A0A914ZY62_PARUN